MKNDFIDSLMAGGVAGLSVDVILYPLDTIKTRLQSHQGFINAGGFKKIYKGLGAQAVGSIPSASLFFCTYDSFKKFTSPLVNSELLPIVYMFGASFGEISACAVRVPIEVVKQRKQVSKNRSYVHILFTAYKSNGIQGLYRGFCSTILREIPFSFIQMPIWELMKKWMSKTFYNNKELSTLNVSICGACAAAISAFVTTPLDVAKTRIMLNEDVKNSPKKLTVINTIANIYFEGGIKRLFSGAAPRTMAITIGGAIFFGFYDLTKKLLD